MGTVGNAEYFFIFSSRISRRQAHLVRPNAIAIEISTVGTHKNKCAPLSSVPAVKVFNRHQRENAG
jgi:hypothetical protein